jgi:tagatose-6-phosphate ketose/aldose isomerase
MKSSIFKSNVSVRESDTENEIWGQPELWIKLWKDFQKIKKELKIYLNEVLSDNEVQIMLTGAGTSSFIGDVLLGSFNKNLEACTSSVATTDLVTHPDLFFNKNKKYLLISFARSGNSPESSQAIILSEECSKEVYHLIITCSSKSNLLKVVSGKKQFTLFMPNEADDKGLAMTGSFTSMLLAGLLISLINKEDKVENQVNFIHQYGNKILNEYSDELKKIAEMDFNRAVFLGSGMLKGVARESQLKLQELTDGKVICKYDSFLGFRHGPKAVINEKTLIVYLFSNNNYAKDYEIDLVKGTSEGRKSLCSVGFMEENINLPELDFKIILSENSKKLEEGFLSVVAVLPAQILGFYKSLHLGLKPDSPSDSGMIHRVVQGVKIHPYINNNSNDSN